MEYYYNVGTRLVRSVSTWYKLYIHLCSIVDTKLTQSWNRVYYEQSVSSSHQLCINFSSTLQSTLNGSWYGVETKMRQSCWSFDTKLIQDCYDLYLLSINFVPTLYSLTAAWHCQIWQNHVRKHGSATHGCVAAFNKLCMKVDMELRQRWWKSCWSFDMKLIQVCYDMYQLTINFVSTLYSSIRQFGSAKFGRTTYGNMAVPRTVVWQYEFWQCHVRSLAVPNLAVPSMEIWQCHVR